MLSISQKTAFSSLTLCFCMLSTNAKIIKDKTPFQMPPNGKGELLIGTDNKLEAPTAMAFDSKNRPYLSNNAYPKYFGYILTIRNGKWEKRSYLKALQAFKNFKAIKGKNLHSQGELVFDDADCLYATAQGNLLYSTDFGKTFKAYPCKGSLEVRSGYNKLVNPPAICQITNRTKSPLGKRWGARSTLSVLLPTKTKDGLKLGEPIWITDKCSIAGSGGHSGGTSFAVSTEKYTHLVYAEAPDNLGNGHTDNNPIYIATIDHKTRKVIARKFLVNAPPKVPDVHTRPTITIDSKGYLHVLSGSHGQVFYYLRSRKPDNITDGWTKPVKPINSQNSQCYAALVCDNNDRLHSVFRQWIKKGRKKGGTANLAYQNTDAKHRWWWNMDKALVVGYKAYEPPRFNYCIFYHRLFIDRKSNLYVYFTYFELKSNYHGHYPEVLIMSKDRGKSWEIMTDKSFLHLYPTK